MTEPTAHLDTSVTGRPLRVLIVDDDALERELYRQFLGTAVDTAYVLTEADTGAAALERRDLADHDCVLLDYCLPDMDGLRLMGKLQVRTDGRVPVILMTGVGNETIATDVLKAGAADYLPKAGVSADSLGRAIASAVERARLREEIRDKTRRIQRQNVELKCRQDEIQRFYQTVSHELKTPLTSMHEFASIIIDGLAGPVSDEQREYVGLIRESCLELSGEIDALLELSLLDSGECRLEPCSVDLRAVIERVVPDQQALAEKKSVTIRHESDVDLARAYADPGRCADILSNLLSNAIKFTDASGGDIHLAARNSVRSPGTVTIAVSDAGCGIAEAELESIFERLYQAESSTHRPSDGASTNGLGIGLTIARRLVELQNGRLWVESEVGVGSMFAFSLPVFRDADTTG